MSATDPHRTADHEARSDRLQSFVAEAPVVREPHLVFLAGAAAALAPGSRVLDVGSGDAPYRELFAAHWYQTCDWQSSLYTPQRPPDFVAPAQSIPLEDASLDAVVCTQVLEHVPDPARVLAELKRVLRPHGRLWITTPLTWYLHETPRDFYRYTSYGLRHLLESVGFADIDLTPMNSSPDTLAQMLRHLGHLLGGPVNDGYDDRRAMAATTAAALADVVASWRDLDTQWILPVSYAAAATRPG